MSPPSHVVPAVLSVSQPSGGGSRWDHRLHSVSKPTSVQQRLANLGFGCALPERSPDECLTAAVRSFQVLVGSDPSGEVTDETRNTLADLHGRRCPFPAEPAIKHKA